MFEDFSEEQILQAHKLALVCIMSAAGNFFVEDNLLHVFRPLEQKLWDALDAAEADPILSSEHGGDFTVRVLFDMMERFLDDAIKETK